MLTIETIEDYARLEALAAEWNPLLQRSHSNCIFLTWEWISTWWQVCAGDNRLLVLVAREAGQLRGIAPLMIRQEGRSPLLPGLRRLMFIGQKGSVYPEYLDFIVEPGREGEVVGAFSQALLGPHRRRWDVLLLERVLSDSPNLGAARRALAGLGVELDLGQSVSCPYVRLPESFESLLNARSQHFKRRFKYNRNRLTRDGQLRYLFAPEDLSIDEAYEELQRLNRERFGERGKSFRAPDYVEMHRRFCELCAARGWLVLCLMQHQGKTVAAKYDYFYAGRIWGNQGGWSLEYQKLSAADVLLGRVMEWGIERGAEEYDFLAWPADYKDRWSSGQRWMIEDIRGFGPGAAGQAARRARQAKAFVASNLSPTALGRLRWLKARILGRPAEVPTAAEPASSDEAV